MDGGEVQRGLPAVSPGAGVGAGDKEGAGDAHVTWLDRYALGWAVGGSHWKLKIPQVLEYEV